MSGKQRVISKININELKPQNVEACLEIGIYFTLISQNQINKICKKARLN